MISGGLAVFCSRGVTTIGKQAEVNSKKMGKDKVQELDALKPKQDTTVAFTDKKKRNELRKKTPQQLEKYLYEGK